MMNVLPCNMPCPKCGGTDIRRRHCTKGQDLRIEIRSGVSTPFVDRSDRYEWPVRQECIVHHCRVCAYEWDTPPLAAAMTTSEIAEALNAKMEGT